MGGASGTAEGAEALGLSWGQYLPQLGLGFITIFLEGSENLPR